MIFTDIAITVGFYAVSRPFFAVNHNLLTTGTENDRFKVSYKGFERELVNIIMPIGLSFNFTEINFMLNHDKSIQSRKKIVLRTAFSI